LRTLFETFGNIRPVRELPGVKTPYSGRQLNIVVVRENIEDLYAGIEYMQTPGVAESLKIVSREGCEKIVRLAFAFAAAEGRHRIHCATKANIMKLTEGLLKQTFEAIAPEFPEIEALHILVDNCAHQLVMRPEQFDVIVTTNMNGDILSDLTSGLTGGLGFAPAANIGNDVAIFEAVHGSAPDIAGQNKANPTALVLSAAMMLRHIGEGAAAESVEEAVVATLESGARMADMQGPAEALSTTAFTSAVIGNLGKHSKPGRARHSSSVPLAANLKKVETVRAKTRSVVGVDIYVECDSLPAALADSLKAATRDLPVKLELIANRGSAVYPHTDRNVSLVDHYRCRFVCSEGGTLSDAEIVSLLQRVGAGHPWMHVEKLQQFDGKDAFTRSQI
jgi:isocitrate dehydrogenase